MKASDIMSAPVVSVSAEASVRDVAAVLSEQRVSGVPVVENGRLVGLVSEADLLRQRDPPGRRARDVMSPEVVTVTADTPIAKVAALLEERGFRRVPVVEAGALVGIVSRANLVQALAVDRAGEGDPADDDAIRRALLRDLGREPWWVHEANAIVVDAVVHLWGPRHAAEPLDAAAARARGISGVRRVEDHRYPVGEAAAPRARAPWLRRAGERGHSRHGWVDAWHTFSFGNYYDPAQAGCGPLRAVNEKRVRPGKGFTSYGLRDVEIVTYLLEGMLEYEDSLDERGTLLPGTVQCLSAGSGVRFSERNGGDSACRFLQFWIEAQRTGVPAACGRRHFPAEAKRGRLALVVSPDARGGSLRIEQDVCIYAGLFEGSEQAKLEVAPGRLGYIHVVRGELAAAGHRLGAGDGLLMPAGPVALRDGRDAEVLAFDLPP